MNARAMNIQISTAPSLGSALSRPHRLAGGLARRSRRFAAHDFRVVGGSSKLRRMSATEGTAVNIFSLRVFRNLTRMYGPAVRCKKISSIWRMCGLASMYPALYGAFEVKHLFHGSLHFLPSSQFLCSTWKSVSSPRPTSVGRRRAQGLSRPAVALPRPHAPLFPGRVLIDPSTAARSLWSG